MFLIWLDGQVICCGDEGQPCPIGGDSSHDWLSERADYYEEIEVDHRAKDGALKALKRAIRLQPDMVQCQEMRKDLPHCPGFITKWTPRDLVLLSRKKVRDRAQHLLFERHKEAFPDEPVPLVYRPKDTRRQNCLVTILEPVVLDGRPDQEELVLNDVVEVPVRYAQEVLDGKWGEDWPLGYAMTIHSSQVWIGL